MYNKRAKQPHWVIKCKHRQTLQIVFYGNCFWNSSTKGCGRWRSFAFCSLQWRLCWGPTTQTSHLWCVRRFNQVEHLMQTQKPLGCHSTIIFKCSDRAMLKFQSLIFSPLAWSLSSWALGSELILRRMLRSEGQLWDSRTGGWGARLFLGTSLSIVGEPSGDEFELGKAMLSGRGLLTSTGEAGALAVIAFKEQTSNQNMIRVPCSQTTQCMSTNGKPK